MMEPIIEKLGKGAESKFNGDRVWVGGTGGTYAEFCVASIDNTHELPDSISFGQEASLFVPARTAYRGLLGRVLQKLVIPYWCMVVVVQLVF